MASVEIALSFGHTQLGKPYSTKAGRFGPNYYDCSGFVWRCLRETGLTDIPLTSSAFSRRLHGAGTGMSLEMAYQTRGAILIGGPMQGLAGIGSSGHVGFSLGNGRTLEAYGSGGVGSRSVSKVRWTYAGWYPGLDRLASSAPAVEAGGDMPQPNDFVGGCSTPTGAWRVKFNGDVFTDRGDHFGGISNVPAGDRLAFKGAVSIDPPHDGRTGGYTIVGIAGDVYDFGPGKLGH